MKGFRQGTSYKKTMSAKYDYDILVIGLGPAGMAVAAMGSAMGLKVCAIEKHAVGGECMNVGCIPSKALLRMGKTRAMFDKLATMQLDSTHKPKVLNPFGKIAESLKYISDKKTMGMFSKVDMVYQQGAASFVDRQTVEVAGRRITAKRIFLCVGTRPEIPDFPGINEVEPPHERKYVPTRNSPPAAYRSWQRSDCLRNGTSIFPTGQQC